MHPNTHDSAAFAALTNLPPRLAFPHEPQSFTRWLGKNLDVLAQAIGVPLRLLEARAIGDRRIADLLARDERSGATVVIENQLEPADDAHLGQILNYAAGVDAGVAVWIAPRFEPHHLAALRWLNDKMGSQTGFYAVSIRLVRIGDSAPGVIFEVLVRPGEGEPAGRSAPSAAPIALKPFAAAFWAEHLRRHPDEENGSRPVGETCRWRATLPKGVVIGQWVQAHAASVFLRGRNGVTLRAARAALAPIADAFEQRLGVALCGERSDLLAVQTLKVNVADAANWPAVSDWLRDWAGKYDAVLRELARRRRDS